jgi:hypothetical protein
MAAHQEPSGKAMTIVAPVPLAARIFVALGWAASLVTGIGAIGLRIIDPAPMVEDTYGFSDVALVGFVVMGIAFASVGSLLVIRRPRNAIGWCMVVTGVGHAAGVFAAAATSSLLAIDTQSALRAAQFSAWVTGFLVTVGGVFLVGIAFIFPTGRGQTHRWDRLVRAFPIVGPIPVLMLVLQPGPLHIVSSIENPFGVGPDWRLVAGVQFSTVVSVAVLLFPPFMVWSLISRYRLAGSIERQQLKWFALAIAVSVGGMAVAAVGAAVSRNPPEAGLAVFGFAGALVPVAIGIAILRYRLYDIDRLISRTIAYAVVTGTLGVIFGSLLLSMTSVMAAVSGGETVAVATSTLAASALFQPVRRRVQRAVDRRFDRSRYDADLTVRAFAARLRDDLDLTAVGAEIVGTASSAVRPTTASIWLRGASR